MPAHDLKTMQYVHDCKRVQITPPMYTKWTRSVYIGGLEDLLSGEYNKLHKASTLYHVIGIGCLFL